MATYQPKPDTLAARAIEFIETATNGKPKGAWVANLEVCTALQVRPNAIRPSLEKAIETGLVEKSMCPSGFTQWRLGVIRPRPRKREQPKVDVPLFSLPDWPPGFQPLFDTVKVAEYETRRK